TPEKLIHEIKPDVLVKGGDWKTSEIIGADFVIGRGGKVVSLPLLDGFGSTAIIDSLKKPKQGNADRKVNGTAAASINQHLEVFSGI
ncbi:hypothetical protein OFM13_31485, partial [Escherichia coli]|nr:hypothetical protein [Escherichia coli]